MRPVGKQSEGRNPLSTLFPTDDDGLIYLLADQHTTFPGGTKSIDHDIIRQHVELLLIFALNVDGPGDTDEIDESGFAHVGRDVFRRDLSQRESHLSRVEVQVEVTHLDTDEEHGQVPRGAFAKIGLLREDVSCEGDEVCRRRLDLGDAWSGHDVGLRKVSGRGVWTGRQGRCEKQKM